MRSPGAINWLRNNYIDATAMRLILNCDVGVQDEIRGEGTLRGLVERANDVHNGVSKQASKALMARIREAVGWVTIQDYVIEEPPTKRYHSYQWVHSLGGLLC